MLTSSVLERPKVTKTPKFAQTVESLLNPVRFAIDTLGMKLHPKQAGVLTDLFPAGKKQSRVSFRCGNEVGKTSHVAVASILYALDTLNAQVISTAGVWMQVVEQLIPNLKRFSNLYPTWRFLDSTISINGIDRYVGFSTRDEGFAQGFHKREGMPLLAIIDEAASVAPGIFNGVEDRCNPDFFLVMGSPLDPAGSFYDIETKLSKFYTHHHLGQPECLTTDGYWIDPVSIERKIAKWGQEAPFIQSNVYGEFSQEIEDGLMSLRDFENCITNPPEHRPNDLQRHAFVDVGRTNVFAVRYGNKVWIEKKWQDRSEVGVCGEIIRVSSRLKQSIGLQADEISVDAGGEYGKIVTDELNKMGWHIHKWYGQIGAVDVDYQNAVSEAWLSGVALMKSCDIIVPNNDELRHQVLTRKKRSHPSGRSLLEPKDEYMKRGFDSPHEGDALFGAMLPITLNKSFNLLGQQQEQDTRGWVERARAGHGGGNFGGLATMEEKR